MPLIEASVKGLDLSSQQGRDHILIDDVFAYGGTLNELRLYIERNGGRVVQTAALTLGRNGNIIALQPRTRDILLYKFGKKRLQSFLKDKEINLYDGNYKNLTEPEAQLIGEPQNLFGGAERLDVCRDRIIAARQTGSARVVHETVHSCQTATVTQTIEESAVLLALRRRFCLVVRMCTPL